MNCTLQQGWAILFTRRAALRKLLKNFAAEGPTDWKSKRKSAPPQMRYFPTENR